MIIINWPRFLFSNCKWNYCVCFYILLSDGRILLPWAFCVLASCWLLFSLNVVEKWARGTKKLEGGGVIKKEVSGHDFRIRHAPRFEPRHGRWIKPVRDYYLARLWLELAQLPSNHHSTSFKCMALNSYVFRSSPPSPWPSKSFPGLDLEISILLHYRIDILSYAGEYCHLK